MNQGKLDAIKQEKARVTTDILGISELKWTAIGEFNLNDHLSTPGQKSLTRNGAALRVNKSPKCIVWVQCQNDRIISVRF